MSLKDDIAAARAGGKPDQDILTAYKAYDPTKAQHIDSALAGGADPGHVLDAVGAYDEQYGDHPDSQSLWSKGTQALQQGAASELTGIANTAKQTIGPGQISDTLDTLGNTAAPTGYQSASAGLGDTTKGISDRAGYIPRSLVEGAPGLATDLLAGEAGAGTGATLGLLGGPLAEVTVPTGAALGGALGFGGSYLLRTFGDSAQKAAQARTGDPNAIPETEDKERALAAGVADAALSRVGISKGLGEAGATSLLPAIQRLGKAAVIDAGTGAATNAIDKAVVEQKDPTDDPTGLALSAGQGAVAGAGLRALTTVGDVNNAVKFNDIQPEHAAALAHLYGDRFLESTTPAKSYDAVRDVDDVLQTQADHWDGRTQPQIDALEASNPRDDTGLALKSVRATLADGNVVHPSWLDELRDRLGDYHEGSNLVDTLTLQNTQNQVKAVGNLRANRDGSGTFGGGLTDSGFGKNLNPFSGLGKLGPAGLGLDLLMEHLLGHVALPPGAAAALEGLQLGTHAAAKGVDGLLRSSNPLQEFLRLHSPSMPPQTARPSFTAVSPEVSTLAAQALLRQAAFGAGN